MNTSVPLGTEFGEQSAPPRLYVLAISGVAVATKSISPRVRVVGVQTESCPSVIRSLEQKHPVIQVSRVTLNLETKGQDHAQEVITTLREAGYKVHPIS